MQQLLIDVVNFLAAALIAVPLSVRLGFGSVPGYLLAGVAICPWALKLITDVDAILHFAELGIARGRSAVVFAGDAGRGAVDGHDAAAVARSPAIRASVRRRQSEAVIKDRVSRCVRFCSRLERVDSATRRSADSAARWERSSR